VYGLTQKNQTVSKDLGISCIAGLDPDGLYLLIDVAVPGTREPYEKLYCARDKCENRIKDAQLDLFADGGNPPRQPSACGARLGRRRPDARTRAASGLRT
jgi:hypothetical protein